MSDSGESDSSQEEEDTETCIYVVSNCATFQGPVMFWNHEDYASFVSEQQKQHHQRQQQQHQQHQQQQQQHPSEPFSIEYKLFSNAELAMKYMKECRRRSRKSAGKGKVKAKSKAKSTKAIAASTARGNPNTVNQISTVSIVATHLQQLEAEEVSPKATPVPPHNKTGVEMAASIATTLDSRNLRQIIEKVAPENGTDEQDDQDEDHIMALRCEDDDAPEATAHQKRKSQNPATITTKVPTQLTPATATQNPTSQDVLTARGFVKGEREEITKVREWNSSFDKYWKLLSHFKAKHGHYNVPRPPHIQGAASSSNAPPNERIGNAATSNPVGTSETENTDKTPNRTMLFPEDPYAGLGSWIVKSEEIAKRYSNRKSRFDNRETKASANGDSTNSAIDFFADDFPEITANGLLEFRGTQIRIWEHQARKHPMLPAPDNSDTFRTTYSLAVQNNLRRLLDLDVVSLRKNPVATTTKKSGIRSDEYWEERFQELVKYKEKHGNTKVPHSTSRVNGLLLSWIHKQKHDYKALKANRKSDMTPERMTRLNDIGLDLMLRATWNERALQWLDFKTKHKRDPKREESDGLGKWVIQQRYRFHQQKEGKNANLTPEMIDKLSSWGFDWRENHKIKRRDMVSVQTWEERLAKFKEYVRETGKTSVPQNHPELGWWAHRQRNEMRKFLQGKRCLINQDKIDQLKEAKFHFGKFRHSSAVMSPKYATTDGASDDGMTGDGNNTNLKTKPTIMLAGDDNCGKKRRLEVDTNGFNTTIQINKCL